MIQIITEDAGYVSNQLNPNQNIAIHSYSKAHSPDDFAITIVDLSSQRLWQQLFSDYSDIDHHMEQVAKSLHESNMTKVVLLYPNKDYELQIGYKYISQAIPQFSSYIDEFIPYQSNGIRKEHTITEISKFTYESDFVFRDDFNSDDFLTWSTSGKATTFVLSDITTYNPYLTTLNILQNRESLIAFLLEIKLITIKDASRLRGKSEPPSWVVDINIHDEEQLQNKIVQQKEIIANAEENIAEFEQRLKEYSKWKSVLYETGDPLVSAVHTLLEKVLNCDLSGFQDKKDEDFLIKLENVTFIGEIKGLEGNVKSSHITQVMTHHGKHTDLLQEAGNEPGDIEKCKGLLIINSGRLKPLHERDAIHNTQIELAKRNDILIIPTNILLDIFDSFLEHKITTEQCIRIFRENSGLLTMEQVNGTTQ